MRRLIPKLTFLRIFLIIVVVAVVVGLLMVAMPFRITTVGLFIAVGLGIIMVLSFWTYYGRARAGSLPDPASEDTDEDTEHASENVHSVHDV